MPIAMRLKKAAFQRVCRLTAVVSLAIASFQCGSSGKLATAESQSICNCNPTAPESYDFRHDAKHIPIPNTTPQEIAVDTILGWPQDKNLPSDAPRTGRELQVFHVGHAFLQSVSINNGDCDIHLEISGTADKNAPRVITETPGDNEYCSARTNIQSQLKQHGFMLDAQHGGELPQALSTEVTGLAFEDFEHKRGSAQVATVWEIHPAIVNVLQ
jgi:hypothetical protein